MLITLRELSKTESLWSYLQELKIELCKLEFSPVAISHFRVKGGSRAKGASGKENFRYLCREGKYQERNDLVWVNHQNYPAWAKDNPQKFWQAADIYERANARIYTEVEIALPRELSPSQQLKLVDNFVRQELGDRHPYTWAYHCPRTLDGQAFNPHIHLMMSERSLVDGIARSEEVFFKRANSKCPEKGGAAKDRDWHRKEKVNELRASWEKAVNLSLKQAGIDLVISMKSLKEQGIARTPEPKLGVVQSAIIRRGESTEKSRLIQSLRTVRNIEASLGGVQKEITETIQDLAREVVEKGNRSVAIPANEIKIAVRDKKMDIYAKLREVEQKRFSLGLMRTLGGEVYQATDSPELQQKRDNTEKRYGKLLGELSATKKYEKQLAVLGSEKIEIIQGKPVFEIHSLSDRQGFLQKVTEAKTRILAKDKSTYHLGLHLEPPQPP